MPRKKKQPVTMPAIDLAKDFLEKLIPGPMNAAGFEAVFQKLKKAVIERAWLVSGTPGWYPGHPLSGRSRFSIRSAEFTENSLDSPCCQSMWIESESTKQMNPDRSNAAGADTDRGLTTRRTGVADRRIGVGRSREGLIK